MMHPAARAMFLAVALLLQPTLATYCSMEELADIDACQAERGCKANDMATKARTICEKNAGCMKMLPNPDVSKGDKDACVKPCETAGNDEQKTCQDKCKEEAARTRKICECTQTGESETTDCCDKQALKQKDTECEDLAKDAKTCVTHHSCGALTLTAKTLCDADEECRKLPVIAQTCTGIAAPECTLLGDTAKHLCDLDNSCQGHADAAKVCTMGKTCGALAGKIKTLCDADTAAGGCKAKADAAKIAPCANNLACAANDKLWKAAVATCKTAREAICKKNLGCAALGAQKRKSCVAKVKKDEYEKDAANPKTPIGKALLEQKEIDRKYEQALQEQELQMQVQLLEAMQQQAKVEASALVAKDEDEDREMTAEDEELMARLRLQGLASAGKVEAAKRVTTPIVATALVALLGLTILAVVTSRRSHSAPRVDGMDSLLKKAELVE